MRTRTSRTRRWASTALIALVFMASTVIAHHGWIEYDQKQVLTISGTITETRYANPHASIRVQAGDNTGHIWRVTLAPPSRMRSRGLPQEALKTGVAATIVGNPHRHHADEIRAQRLTIGDKTYELR
jgi:hypothetical protein